jgi:hypothetical protein
VNEPLVGDEEAEEKIIESEPEKFNPSLNFSGNEPASEATPYSKMKYEGRDKGRQRKYYETIALLEMHYVRDNRIWDKLDEQMQRYYRREYPEYFDRDNKDKREQRQSNKAKAARIRHERLQREVKGAAAKDTSERVEPLDFQVWRDKVSG